MAFKFLKFLTESFAWLQIVASPTLAGVIIGAVVYAFKRDNVGLIIAIVVASIGFLAGIIWATKIGRKRELLNLCQK